MVVEGNLKGLSCVTDICQFLSVVHCIYDITTVFCCAILDSD